MRERNKVFKFGRFRLQAVVDPPRFALGCELEYDKEYGTLAIQVKIGPLFFAFWYNVTAEIIE